MILQIKNKAHSEVSALYWEVRRLVRALLPAILTLCKWVIEVPFACRRSYSELYL